MHDNVPDRPSSKVAPVGWQATWRPWHLQLKLSLSQMVGCARQKLSPSLGRGQCIWAGLHETGGRSATLAVVNRLGRRRATRPWAPTRVALISASAVLHRGILHGNNFAGAWCDVAGRLRHLIRDRQAGSTGFESLSESWSPTRCGRERVGVGVGGAVLNVCVRSTRTAGLLCGHPPLSGCAVQSWCRGLL